MSILVLLFIVEIVGAAAGYIMRNKLNGYIKHAFQNGIDRYHTKPEIKVKHTNPDLKETEFATTNI